MSKTDVLIGVKVSGVNGLIIGTVVPMDPSSYTAVGQLLEEAKQRGQLSIKTADGVVAINTDHIILINETEGR